MSQADSMYAGAEEHVIYKIANAPLREYPFPHLYIDSIFPADFYSALRRNWPSASQLVALESTGRVTKGSYPERFIMPLREKEVQALPEDARKLWSELAQWMLFSSRFLKILVQKFEPYMRARFGTASDKVRLSQEALVVRDHTNYNLGPHTDSPHHLMSLLFYCPDDETYRELGTSIYTPIDPAFRCAGGPHYPHDLFRKVATMEFRPNALFAFFKTDNSFHGVDPITDSNVLRDLILYDIQVSSTTAAETEKNRGSLGVRMLKNIFRH